MGPGAEVDVGACSGPGEEQQHALMKKGRTLISAMLKTTTKGDAARNGLSGETVRPSGQN